MTSDMKSLLHQLSHILRSPLGIITGIIFGIAAGNLYPEYGRHFGEFGDIFISLMKMCVIPILVTSVSLSVTQFTIAKSGINIKKVVALFAISFLLIGFIGVVVTTLMSPGKKIDISASPVLYGAAIKSAQIERSLDTSLQPRTNVSFIKFLTTSIPDNVFESISGDQYLQILIFSIILGIALAFIKTSYSNNLTLILSGIKEIFTVIFGVVTFVLPLAIFLIVAKQISEVGLETIIGLIQLVFCAYITFFIMFMINSIIIALATKTRYLKALSFLKEPLTLAIVTRSSIATIPSAIAALIDNFKLDKVTVNLLVSIGFIIGQFGIALYFAIAAVFIAQFYGVELDLYGYIFIIISSALASLSAIGSSGVLILPISAMITDPLGLPLQALLVLFIAIDSIIEPLRTLILVQTNCAILALISKKDTSAPKIPI